jgi:hypothetical protein
VPTSPETTIVFLHLPKAAGSTLGGVLARQYEPGAVHAIEEPVWENLDRFKALPESRRHAVRLLMGHMPFGLHEWLRPPVRYVTMLREPLGRVASHFHYVLERPSHELFERLRPGMTVGDYVRERTSLELDNGQVRLLSADPFVEFGAVTREHLETAKRNLREHFEVVGVSERFDESLLAMRAALGWRRRILYVERNVTGARRHPPTPQDARAVLEANRLDAELHAFAGELLAARTAGREAELRRFRAANRAYGALARAWLAVRGRPGTAGGS